MSPAERGAKNAAEAPSECKRLGVGHQLLAARKSRSMNYRGLFWVLVAVAIMAFLLLAIDHKVRHPQPVYEQYLGYADPSPYGVQLASRGESGA